MTPTEAPIRVAIVEDNPECREDLRALIDGTPGFSCRDVHASAELALAALPGIPPDLYIVDLDLPGMGGEAFMRALRERGIRSRPVVLTAYNDPARIGAALEAGAFGYLLKETSTAELVARLRDAHAGGAPMSPAVSLIVVQIFHRRGEIERQLGPRLFHILLLLSTGRLIDEIADELRLAPGSIRASLSHIYGALHVDTASQAVALFHGAPPR
ncbi:MAG: response regulator transcription factor [Verrucomicrobia bacterium]|nr:MAG: response regulator transcription factor [Verrucomicrobiota bacterium]